LYREAFVALWQWLGRSPPDRVLDPVLFDALLGEYFEHLWESGGTRGKAGNTLSASLAAYPELRRKGSLADSWYLLHAWSRVEVPNRAPPLPAKVCLAIAGFFILEGDWMGAFLVLLSFDAFLRTGELTDLQLGDLSFSRTSGVVRLPRTKSGQRHAAFEAVVIQDPLVIEMWDKIKDQWPQDSSPSSYVYPGQPKRFGERFTAAIKHFNLGRLNLRLYSLRRGGATAFFRRAANMDLTLERGRWATKAAGRIYVNDGLGKEIEMLLSPYEHSLLSGAIAQLRLFLATS